MIAFLFSMVALLLLFPLTVSAHSGGTDSKGGHYDHDTGEYHYHHGYPAHSHYDMDGDGDIDCRYDFKDKTTISNTNKIQSEDADHNSPNIGFILFLLSVVLCVFFVTIIYLNYSKKRHISCSNDRIVARIKSDIDVLSGEQPEYTRDFDFVQKNYKYIDHTIEKINKIQQYVKEEKTQYNNRIGKLDWQRDTYIFCAGGLIVIDVIILLCCIFTVENALLFILATVLLVPMLFMFVNGKVSDKLLHYDLAFYEKIEQHAIETIEKHCNEIRNRSIDPHLFFGVPETIAVVKGKMSIGEIDAKHEFGDFTRYTTFRGVHFHRTYMCSGAFSQDNLLELVHKGTHKPCSKCARTDDDFAVPQWYVYYVKVNSFLNDFHLELSSR